MLRYFDGLLVMWRYTPQLSVLTESPVYLLTVVRTLSAAAMMQIFHALNGTAGIPEQGTASDRRK